MNTQINSLYRKYRPKKFAEVFGQEHITKTIQNQILKNKVDHAYLFCGTRGTGKTTIARIFAKTLNKSETNDFGNIIELDAATNNSIDNVRDLVEKTKYPPTAGNYKIYIIDEVHMFSNSAFNALLKLIEEPSPYIVFILCTTEPHKLPQTIHSRVLRFDFRPIPQKDLEQLIKNVFEKEKIKASNEAISEIAKSGNGSARDTLSLAETIAAFAGEEEITIKHIESIRGSVSTKTINELIGFVTTSNYEQIIKTVETIFNSSVNPNILIADMLKSLKELFLVKKDKKLIEAYKVFAELEQTIKTSPNPKTLFEGACLYAAG